jgi:predicted transcriptional regulator
MDLALKETCGCMHRSKLELYEAILAALSRKPQTVDNIAFECDIDCVVLSKLLEFLVRNGLAQQCRSKNKICFALTERGHAINRTFNLAKRLEKLQEHVVAVKEALQAPVDAAKRRI